MARILLVDDEPGVLFTLEEVLSERGYETISATSGEQALERLDGVEAVLTDLAMPGMDGLELLRAVKEKDPHLPVVLITARGSERVAVVAMKDGAYDYLAKPYDIEELALVVERAVEARRLRQTARRLSAERAIGRPIIGESPALRRVIDAALRIADRDVTVLVRGETGTGKELFASLLHAESRRKDKPIVRFNCAAIPADLADAELFGHVKGAFTGAVNARRGYFAQAHGGTLVLDEVGELPLPIQAKLLRALQEGEIQPVGAARIEHVDVRVVSCTNRDLLAEVKAGRFREDLYYRLAVVELFVPPLRDRREDIPLLVEEMRRRYVKKFGVEDVRLSGALLERLVAYDWPGNVRELENTLARLIAMSSGEVLDAAAFAPTLAKDDDDKATSGEDAAPAAAPGASEDASFRDQMMAFERSLIARALEASGGNQSEAARQLGITRVTLIDKMKKHGLFKARVTSS